MTEPVKPNVYELAYTKAKEALAPFTAREAADDLTKLAEEMGLYDDRNQCGCPDAEFGVHLSSCGEPTEQAGPSIDINDLIHRWNDVQMAHDWEWTTCSVIAMAQAVGVAVTGVGCLNGEKCCVNNPVTR